jgi:hypothetical protein
MAKGPDSSSSYRQDILPERVEQAAKACVPHAPPALSAAPAPRTIVPRSGPTSGAMDELLVLKAK